MAIQIIGNGGTVSEVDTTSRAHRVTLYDPRGNSMAQKATYRAATDPTVVAAASATAPFFVIYGSASKTLRVQMVRVTGSTTTTLAAQGVTLRKYSTAPSGGTIVALTQVPLDSTNAAATASLCQVYTAAPTAGTTLGVIGSVRFLNKSATIVDGSPMHDTIFEFRPGDEVEAVVLRGTTQGIGLQLHVATATTCAVTVMWTEE